MGQAYAIGVKTRLIQSVNRHGRQTFDGFLGGGIDIVGNEFTANAPLTIKIAFNVDRQIIERGDHSDGTTSLQNIDKKILSLLRSFID